MNIHAEAIRADRCGKCLRQRSEHCPECTSCDYADGDCYSIECDSAYLDPSEVG